MAWYDVDDDDDDDDDDDGDGIKDELVWSNPISHIRGNRIQIPHLRSVDENVL